MDDQYQLITKTAAGLEDVLAAEIKALGAKNVRCMHRALRRGLFLALHPSRPQHWPLRGGV